MEGRKERKARQKFEILTVLGTMAPFHVAECGWHSLENHCHKIEFEKKLLFLFSSALQVFGWAVERVLFVERLLKDSFRFG